MEWFSVTQNVGFAALDSLSQMLFSSGDGLYYHSFVIIEELDLFWEAYYWTISKEGSMSNE